MNRYKKRNHEDEKRIERDDVETMEQGSDRLVK